MIETKLHLCGKYRSNITATVAESLLFRFFRVQRCWTTPNGIGLLMPSLWFLLSSLWFPGWSFSLSGKCRKWPICDTGRACRLTRCMSRTGWSTVPGCTRWTTILPSLDTTSSTWCWWFFSCCTSTGLSSYPGCFTSSSSAWCVFPNICFSFPALTRCMHSYGSPSPLCLICILQLEGDDRSDQEEDDTDPPSDKRQSHINGSGTRDRASGHWHTLTVEEISFEPAIRI